MFKFLFAIGKFFIGSVSFKGGFWGGIFGIFMVLWSITDLITLFG